MIAVAIGLWVLPRTWALLKESLSILLEGVPDGIDVQEVEKAICAVAGVSSVHDLHIWSLTSGKSSLTAHVVHEPERGSATALLPALQEVLTTRFKVFHTTLQLETAPCQHTADGCNYVAQNPSTDEDADPC